MSGPCIIIFTDSFAGTRYETECEHFAGESYESVKDALQKVSDTLESENATLGSDSKIFILNTVTGETYQYVFIEQPKRFIARGV